jgi:hypothetical protein
LGHPQQLIMTSVSPQPALERLTEAFRHYLQETNLYPRLTALDCHNQQGRVLVLAQHPMPTVADPASLLRELKAAFFEIMAEVGLPKEWADLQEMPVRLGLQLEFEDAPYATHTFTWRAEDALGIIFEPPCPEEWGAAAEIEGQTQPIPDELADSEAVEALESGNDPDHAGAMESGSEAEPAAAQPPSANVAPFNDAALALPETAVDPPAESLLRRWGLWGQGQVERLTPYWSYGLAGLILLSSGLFAYVITRPCVVGSCDRIDRAAAFHAAAVARLGTSPTGPDLQEARSDLQAAKDWVTPIPHWSPHYAAARGDLNRYRADLVSLNRLTEAQSRAYTAAQKSQDPPHPVARWVEIQHFWRQAIAALEAIPDTSPVYDFAQAKLSEYRGNLATITQRVMAEEEAEARLNNAIQSGRLAQQQMDTATSLVGWQQANQQWQLAIQSLTSIPQGTEAYATAQAQLRQYRSQQAQVQARLSQEGSASSTYQQAQAAASQAQAYEAQSQWTLAVSQWKIALATLQQVASDSALSASAKMLLPNYQASLSRSQAQLRTAVVLQTLETTPGSVCRSTATPCRISASPDQIRVTLTGQYAAALEQAITPPAAGTAVAATPLSRETQAMVEQIVRLGNQVQRQIDIYNSGGQMIARYRPDLGGFVKN